MSLHHRVLLETPENVPHITVPERMVCPRCKQIEERSLDFDLEGVPLRGKLLVAFAGDEIHEEYVVVEEDVLDGFPVQRSWVEARGWDDQ